jgi:hypothetical protein
VQMRMAGTGQVVKAQLVIHDEQNIHGGSMSLYGNFCARC